MKIYHILTLLIHNNANNNIRTGLRLGGSNGFEWNTKTIIMYLMTIQAFKLLLFQSNEQTMNRIETNKHLYIMFTTK